MPSNQRREAPAGPEKCTNCGVKHRLLTSDDCLDRSMSEKTLQARVVGRAKRLGWTVAHAGKGWVGDAESGAGQFVTPMAPGWPDLFMLNPKQAPYRLAIELKREQGVVDDKQYAWLALLNECGIPAVIVRPSDLRLGHVNAILRGQ